MAKDKDKDKESLVEGEKPAKAAKPSIMAVILPVLLLSLIAAGGGFAVATVLGSQPAAVTQPAASGETGEHPATSGEHAGTGTIVRQLAPIITNLSSPKDTWIRLEVAIVINPEAQADQDMVAVRSSDQILTMLRTVSLSQIEGPSAFLHFKEDINDLLRENSDNKVSQVLISSMVVE